jgi:hypothetical protein
VDSEGFTPLPRRLTTGCAGELTWPAAALGSAGPVVTDVESVAAVSAAATPNVSGNANERPAIIAAALTAEPFTNLIGMLTPERSATNRGFRKVSK